MFINLILLPSPFPLEKSWLRRWEVRRQLALRRVIGQLASGDEGLAWSHGVRQGGLASESGLVWRSGVCSQQAYVRLLFQKKKKSTKHFFFLGGGDAGDSLRYILDGISIVRKIN